VRLVDVLVEGSTETAFVEGVLQPYFWKRNLHLEPKLIRTSKGNYGGVVSYGNVKFNIERLLRNSGVVAVTTMIDFYGLDGLDFPGWSTMKGDCYKKVQHVEEAIDHDIDHIRFRPYLALHEFEALLFSKPEIIAQEEVIEDIRVINSLKSIRGKYASPEEINFDAPPSKRILELIPTYRKEVAGALIAVEIGLDSMREQCPHFDQWMEMLEALA
jgi:hypothetical protein